jgi:hypothetical protein
VRDPQVAAAVDRLVGRRGATHVLVGPAKGPAHREASVKLRKKDWEVVRGLVPRWELDPAADPVVFGREQAARLAADLRAAFDRCPAGGRKGLEKVLAVLKLGNGLMVSGVVA